MEFVEWNNCKTYLCYGSHRDIITDIYGFIIEPRQFRSKYLGARRLRNV
jgi:hypothetical protein